MILTPRLCCLLVHRRELKETNEEEVEVKDISDVEIGMLYRARRCIQGQSFSSARQMLPPVHSIPSSFDS